MVLIVDLNKSRPIIRAIQKSMTGHKERKTQYRSLVKSSMKMLIIFLIIRINFLRLVHILTQLGHLQLHSISLIMLIFHHNSTAISLQVGYINRYITIVVLIRREFLAVGPVEVVDVLPWVLQHPVGLVAIESGVVLGDVSQVIYLVVLAWH